MKKDKQSTDVQPTNKTKDSKTKTTTAKQKPVSKEPKQKPTKQIDSTPKTKEPKKQKVKEKEKKERQPLTKRSLASLCVLLVLGIATGSVVGVWFKKNLLGTSLPPPDYASMSEAELRDDAYDIAVTQGYTSKVPFKEKNSIINAFIAAEYNLGNFATSYYTYANGIVDTIAQQEIYTEKMYDGTTYYGSSISAGIISVGELALYNKSTPDQVTVIVGEKISKKSTGNKINCSLDNCGYNGQSKYIYNVSYPKAKAKTQTLDEYKAIMGIGPDTIIPYIVSSKTVINDPSQTFKKVTDKDGAVCYNFQLVLDPQTSVKNYVNQMSHMSGLNDLPAFTSVVVNVSLTMVDGRIHFKTIDIDEHYSIKYGILTPQCNGRTHQEFIINKPVTLPEVV